MIVPIFIIWELQKRTTYSDSLQSNRLDVMIKCFELLNKARSPQFHSYLPNLYLHVDKNYDRIEFTI